MRGELRVSMDPKVIKGEYLNSAYSELANLIGIDAVLKIHYIGISHHRKVMGYLYLQEVIEMKYYLIGFFSVFGLLIGADALLEKSKRRKEK